MKKFTYILVCLVMTMSLTSCLSVRPLPSISLNVNKAPKQELYASRNETRQESRRTRNFNDESYRGPQRSRHDRNAKW